MLIKAPLFLLWTILFSAHKAFEKCSVHNTSKKLEFCSCGLADNIFAFCSDAADKSGRQPQTTTPPHCIVHQGPPLLHNVADLTWGDHMIRNRSPDLTIWPFGLFWTKSTFFRISNGQRRAPWTTWTMCISCTARGSRWRKAREMCSSLATCRTSEACFR